MSPILIFHFLYLKWSYMSSDEVKKDIQKLIGNRNEVELHWKELN